MSEDTIRALLLTVAGAIVTFAGVVARSMFTTVREASKVVGTRDTQDATILALRKTIDAQAECIEAQEVRIGGLEVELGEATRRIAKLEAIIRELRKEPAR